MRFWTTYFYCLLGSLLLCLTPVTSPGTCNFTNLDLSPGLRIRVDLQPDPDPTSEKRFKIRIRILVTQPDLQPYLNLDIINQICSMIQFSQFTYMKTFRIKLQLLFNSIKTRTIKEVDKNKTASEWKKCTTKYVLNYFSE